MLSGIAPEADLDTLDPTAQLQEELDLDSINFLDFVSGVHDRTGVDIPERELPPGRHPRRLRPLPPRNLAA